METVCQAKVETFFTNLKKGVDKLTTLCYTIITVANLATFRKLRKENGMTNVELLLGKLGAKRINITGFAKAMGFSRPTARRKVYGEAPFTVAEISKASNLLGLTQSEMIDIFLSNV